MKEVGVLEKIRIQNIRSLKDTGMVPLSPITLLVGENSSGKSTFLRTFPLIKQSICKRTNGPILWAGDVDDYVDFGSFAETVTNDKSKDMTLSFAFTTNIIQRNFLWMRFPSLRRSKSSDIAALFPRENHVLYSITISQAGGREYVSNVQINLNNSHFVFELSPESSRGTIIVDGLRFDSLSKNDSPLIPPYMTSTANSELFEYALPSILSIREDLFQKFYPKDGEDDALEEEDDAYSYSYRYSGADPLFQVLGQFLCADYSWPKAKNSLKKLDFGNSRPILDFIIQTLDKMQSKAQKETLAKLKLVYFYEAFPRIERYLDQYFHQVHYIAPLRATAERYYRLRNLAIDEVDYQGKNLAVFLNGLSSNRKQGFKQWTMEHFGFQVDVKKESGHISLQVSLKNGGAPVNISDTGFGYSQILPIITQLWDLSSQERHSGVPLVIAIEQPELHLHPALQAKLVNAFIACIKLAEEKHYQLQFLIETHSETIVNYFGRAIAEEKISSGDVSLVLFDKDIKTGRTDVRLSEYGQDGYLQNWPLGFFSPKE